MLDPDPNEMNADPQPWYRNAFYSETRVRLEKKWDGYVQLLKCYVSIPLTDSKTETL